MDGETTFEEQLIETTTRLCRRYIDEIVLPFSLCPWAAPALTSDKVQMLVITAEIARDFSYAEAAQTVFCALDEDVEPHSELVLILLPRCSYSRLQMDDLLRAVRALGSQRGHERSGESAPKGEGSFALAAFHPEAGPDTTSPERFIPYLRRSPDPMIQAVRNDILTKIDPDRGSGTAYLDPAHLDLHALSAPAPEPLRLRVARSNLHTAQTEGLEQLEARFQSIFKDRDHSYRDLIR